MVLGSFLYIGLTCKNHGLVIVKYQGVSITPRAYILRPNSSTDIGSFSYHISIYISCLFWESILLFPGYSYFLKLLPQPLWVRLQLFLHIPLSLISLKFLFSCTCLIALEYSFLFNVYTSLIALRFFLSLHCNHNLSAFLKSFFLFHSSLFHHG